MRRDCIFTSESVSEGHPDKVCDLISDAILDANLTRDLEARCAIETLVTKDTVIIAGEVAGKNLLTAQEREGLIRAVVKDIGYDQPGFSYESLKVVDLLHAQSADIALGVDLEGGELGAGDQGMMIGYACSETDVFMPAPIHYANRIMENVQKDRKLGLLSGLGPDAKVQLSVKYEAGRPVGTTCIVFSTQHEDAFSQEQVKTILTPYVEASLPEGWMCDSAQFLVNPTGRFVVGGPVADTGLTGRKIIVDTYGSAAPHGGGAFSGKDASKVDRSGAYMARYIAKNVVASGIAEECTIQLAYGIGLAEPLSLFLDTHGTSSVAEAAILEFLKKALVLTPRGIIETLDLKRPIYKKTAAYGHFGRSYDAQTGAFSWEDLDLANIIAHEFHIAHVRAY